MIKTIHIDVYNRTLTTFDEEGQPIVQPGSHSGGPEIRYTKSSAGGLIIQALVRLLVNREGRV